MIASSSNTLDRGAFAIGVLSVTAVVMMVGLALVQMMPATVRADGMSVSGGDYIMTVGALAATDEEYVYVVDVPSSKLAIYRFDATRHEIQIVQGIELSNLRTPAGEPIPIADDEEADESADDDPTAPQNP